MTIIRHIKYLALLVALYAYALARGLRSKGFKTLVGITPSAGNKIKEWPTERFAAVADHVIEKYGAAVLVFGGPKDGARSILAARDSSRKKAEAAYAKVRAEFTWDKRAEHIADFVLKEKPKKILIIAPAIGTRSGWARLVLEVLEQFKAKSLSFVVYAERTEAGFGQWAAGRLFRGPWGLIKNVRALRAAAKECGAVHSFDGWPYAVYGYLSVLGTSKKLFITGVGTYSVMPLGSWFKGPLLKRAYMRATEIMCISSYTARRIRERVPAANATVVHMGLTRMTPVPPETIDSKRKAFAIESGQRPLLLTVGALKNRKGQLDCVVACARLVKKYPDMLYCMVGSDKDAEYVGRIKEYIATHGLERNVRIVADAGSDEDLAFFYQSADAFLLPSRNSRSGNFEGFGLVLLEAAQFGVPSIGTTDCGVEDALIDGKTGYLVEQGRPDMIAEAIEKILLGDRVAFSKNAIEFARSFSWSRTADAYREAFFRE